VSSQFFPNPDFHMDVERHLYTRGVGRSEDTLQEHTPPLPGDLSGSRVFHVWTG